jgi:hypothetical protein
MTLAIGAPDIFVGFGVSTRGSRLGHTADTADQKISEN